MGSAWDHQEIQLSWFFVVPTSTLTARFLPGIFCMPLRRILPTVMVMSSISGYIGLPSRSLYCASKFALNGFIETLALELKVGPIPASQHSRTTGNRDDGSIYRDPR